jgi:hypothetical protein
MAARPTTPQFSGGNALRRHARRSLPAVAGLLALGSLLAVRILVADPFERLRLAAFDAFQRTSPHPYAA